MVRRQEVTDLQKQLEFLESSKTNRQKGDAFGDTKQRHARLATGERSGMAYPL